MSNHQIRQIRLGEFCFLLGLCLWSWTIPLSHTICLSMLIINQEESPTCERGKSLPRGLLISRMTLNLFSLAPNF